MPDNSGFLMLLGLGALFFLGAGRRPEGPESEGTATVVTSSGVPAVVVSQPGIVTTSTKAPIDGEASESIVLTSLEVQRREQVARQRFDWAAGAVAPPTKVMPSRGDIEAAEIAAGTFEYGGATRPTDSAIPVWNSNYGWYWANPATGLPVGAGGVQWSPTDTGVHMGAEGTNIGRSLPSGWVDTGGGSARLVTAAPNTINQQLTVSEAGAPIVLDAVNGYGMVYVGAEDE